MERMSENFIDNLRMEKYFSKISCLLEILDTELYEHMNTCSTDYSQYYFSYRWFLLDFKRELLYDDVFITWETIWTSKHVCSSNFSLFIALALIETYRDIIIDNKMDYTDIIKFFNGKY